VESEDGRDLNHMLSSMNIKQLTTKQYQPFCIREIARKRAAGEYVPISKYQAPTVAKGDHAKSGKGARQTHGCKK